jgi:hypothetical protein
VLLPGKVKILGVVDHAHGANLCRRASARLACWLVAIQPLPLTKILIEACDFTLLRERHVWASQVCCLPQQCRRSDEPSRWVGRQRRPGGGFRRRSASDSCTACPTVCPLAASPGDYLPLLPKIQSHFFHLQWLSNGFPKERSSTWLSMLHVRVSHLEHAGMKRC